MSMDDFEKRMQRQPLKRIPGEWREEVLRAARLEPARVEMRDHSARSEGDSWRSSWRRVLLSLRWHLAGMSAVWLLAAILNLSSAESSNPAVSVAVNEHSAASVSLLATLREHQRQVVELLGQRALDAAPPPPRRSQLPSATVIV